MVARRRGREWYVGAMTDWTARSMEIDLSFLRDGKFQMDSYEDGTNADRVGNDFRTMTTQVDKNSRIKITMAAGGGWAAHIYPN